MPPINHPLWFPSTAHPQNRLIPNIRTLSFTYRTGKLQAASNFRRPRPDLVLCNTLLGACERMLRWQQALLVLQDGEGKEVGIGVRSHWKRGGRLLPLLKLVEPLLSFLALLSGAGRSGCLCACLPNPARRIHSRTSQTSDGFA